MSLLPKSIHRCRRYPTKFNSGRDIPFILAITRCSAFASWLWSIEPGVIAWEDQHLGAIPTFSVGGAAVSLHLSHHRVAAPGHALGR